MPIRIDGKVTVDAPMEQVWGLILDPDILKRTADRVPGVELERLVQIDEMHYEGTVTIGVAMVKGKYDAKITVIEKTAPTFMRVKGEGKGGGNWTSGDMALTLSEQDGKTLMSYTGQGNVSGPLASVGQRLFDTVGHQIIDQGTKMLAEEISARYRAKTGAPDV
jgi:uncharacterized protein